jgi:hypothetical protein
VEKFEHIYIEEKGYREDSNTHHAGFLLHQKFTLVVFY